MRKAERQLTFQGELCETQEEEGQATTGVLTEECYTRRMGREKQLTFMLTPTSVAKMKGCARMTVIRAIHRGELDAFETTTPNGRMFFGITPETAARWTPRTKLGRPKEKSK